MIDSVPFTDWGTAKASQILVALELIKCYLIRTNRCITDAANVYRELTKYADHSQEYFLTITLDGASHIIQTRTVFIGTLNQSLVHLPLGLCRCHLRPNRRHHHRP